MRAHVTDYLIGVDQKFQTGWLRCFWGRPKLQLGQVLSLGVVPWALVQVMPFWGLYFLFNTVKFHMWQLQGRVCSYSGEMHLILDEYTFTIFKLLYSLLLFGR